MAATSTVACPQAGTVVTRFGSSGGALRHRNRHQQTPVTIRYPSPPIIVDNSQSSTDSQTSSSVDGKCGSGGETEASTDRDIRSCSTDRDVTGSSVDGDRRYHANDRAMRAASTQSDEVIDNLFTDLMMGDMPTEGQGGATGGALTEGKNRELFLFLDGLDAVQPTSSLPSRKSYVKNS